MTLLSAMFNDQDINDLIRMAEGSSVPRIPKARVTEFREKFNNKVFVGQRMAQRRQELGLAQADVAMVLGVTRELISMIETGRAEINAGDLAIIGKILDVRAAYFVDTAPPKASGDNQTDREQQKTNTLLFLMKRLPEGCQDAVIKVAQSLYDTLRKSEFWRESERAQIGTEQGHV